MALKEFLALPAVRAVAIRTAKNIIVLGATATVAFFSNNIFKTQANSALKSALDDYDLIKSIVRS
jgi:hypothetical protein